jgi:hypothetical protein
MFKRTVALLVMAGSVIAVWAQDQNRSPNIELGVSIVRSGLQRAEAGDSWYAVEIGVRTKATGSSRDRFADRVMVRLSLATESKEVDGGLEFYQAQATAVALEAGEHFFRFYLPPEIVKRDRLQGSLRFWSVDLAVEGRELPTNRDQVGPGFSNVSALENFRQKVSQNAKINAGILVPQHLTPMAVAPGVDNTPAMVRLEISAPANR